MIKDVNLSLLLAFIVCPNNNGRKGILFAAAITNTIFLGQKIYHQLINKKTKTI